MFEKSIYSLNHKADLLLHFTLVLPMDLQSKGRIGTVQDEH